MNIHIESPCSESWEKMKAVEGGRFCDACKCKVHDFSGSTEEEINRQYALNNGKLCARITKNLLVEQFQNAVIRKGYFYNLKIFCLATILSFGASLFTIHTANAKGMLRRVRSEILNFEKKDNKLISEITVKGIVRDKETKEALIGAVVQAQINDSTVMTVVTDLDGKYELKIEEGNYQKIDLKVKYLAYTDTIIKNIPLVENVTIDVEMQASPESKYIETTMGISIQRIEPFIPMSEPLIKPGKRKKKRDR